ncbi:hypothetical protein KY358_05155 [Candidatus Woesearchaeota archaeon]|nr:hypothetical protein [Candidatus Woesearchaeota archaeon]
MAEEGSYEIMPYKEIVELKRQISELQKKTGDTSSKELLDSMAALTKSMNGMLQLFSSAAEEMKLEEKEEHVLSEKLGPLIEKVDSLEKQNETIAEGLVAVADMVKDMKEGKPRVAKAPKKKETGLPKGPMEFPPPRPMPPNVHGGPRIVAKQPMPPPGAPMPPPFESMMPAPPPRGPMPPPGAPMPPPEGMMPPPPDMSLPPLEEKPKKKKHFGLFRKK